MIIVLNGLSLNDPSKGNGLWLDEPIDGLGLAPIRTSQSNYSGRDGGYVSAQFKGIRLITLTGRAYATSTLNLYAIRRTLENAVDQPTVTMLLYTDDGGQYLVNAKLDSLSMPIMRTVVRADFQITLLAGDTNIYDNSAGGVNTAAITRATGGGLTWPLSWPMTWASGGAPTTVTNSGAVIAYPTITLTGSMTSPIITNVTTGQFFSLPNLVTGPSDVLVIDMRRRTVLLNGGSVYQLKGPGSTWWALTTGSNSLRLTTGNSSDTVTGSLSWRSAVKGI